MTPLGVILAGGAARRMGGVDKALLALGGRPLLDHAAARLAPQTAGLALSANGDPSRFAGFGLEVLSDAVPDRPGPLAGVLAGLDWAAGRGASHIVTLPCDAPFAPLDLAARLVEAAQAAGTPLAMAAAPDAAGTARLQPVFALWSVALRERLRADLAAGARRVGAWAQAQGCARALFPAAPRDPFFNVNSPADLAEAERLLRAADAPS